MTHSDSAGNPTTSDISVLVVGDGPSKSRAAEVEDLCHATVAANMAYADADYIATVDVCAAQQIKDGPLRHHRVVTIPSVAAKVPREYDTVVHLKTPPPSIHYQPAEPAKPGEKIEMNGHGSICWTTGHFIPGTYMDLMISGVFALQVAINLVKANHIYLTGFDGGPDCPTWGVEQAIAVDTIMRACRDIRFDWLRGPPANGR